MRKIILLLFVVLLSISCEQGGDGAVDHTYVVITSSASINGENKFIYRVSGTCRGQNKKVIVKLTDESGQDAPPRKQPTCSIDGNWSAQVDVSMLEEGDITIIAVHEDFIGRSYSTSKRVFKDTVPLNLVIASPGNILAVSEENYSVSGDCTEKGREVTVALSDSGSIQHSLDTQTTCREGTWEVAVDTRGLEQGEITITATHGNSDGNSIVKTAYTTKDIEGGRVRIDTFSDITAALEGEYRIAGTCSEDREPIMVKLNDGGEIPNSATPDGVLNCSSGLWEAEVKTDKLEDGNIAIIVIHRDSSGNLSSDAVEVKKDVEEPSLSIDNPKHIFADMANSYDLNGECSESGVSVTVKLENSAQSSEILNTQVSCLEGIWELVDFNVSTLAEGVVTITVSQSDALGNLGTASGEIQKSNSDLVVTLNLPPAINSANEDNYVLEGGCNPDAGELTVRVGGISPRETPTCSRGFWSANFNLDELAESNSILITVDYSHNQGADNAEQERATVLKDVQGSTVSLVSPTDIDRITDSSYTLSGTCSENGRAVSISIDNSQGASHLVESQAVCGNNSWEKPVDVSALEEGGVMVTVTHADLAGNSSRATGTADRDNSIVITIEESPHIDSDNESSYELSGTCSEEGQEVTVSVGSVSPGVGPVCGSNFEWSVDNLDVSVLDDGEVSIAAVHKNISANASIHKGCFSEEESGAAGDPIIICNYNALKGVNNGLNKYYILGADIDASASWSEGDEGCNAYDGSTIAATAPCSGMSPLGRFTGHFDGNNYKIRNLYIHTSQESLGLFSELSGTGVIKNVHLRDVQLKNTAVSDDYPSVGALLGIAGPSTTVDNCSATGHISGENDAGGLVGFSEGKLTNSYVNATVAGKFAGSLLAYSSSASIISSHGAGTVRGDGTSESVVGGLIGGTDSSTVIRNSFAKANVSNASKRGSLVGEIHISSIFNCYAIGVVSTGTGDAGGLLGNISTVDGNSTVQNSFWDTEKTGWATSPGGTGLTTAQMQMGCAGGSSNAVCSLGAGLVFSMGSYPKIKKCLNCSESNTTFSNDLVMGQN